MYWNYQLNQNKYNNNNNNDNNSCNKDSATNKDNVTLPPPSQNSKETVFILGNWMVKKLNGFSLRRKLNHKCLVKVRPFSSEKVRCMHDHLKLTVRDLFQTILFLQCVTNDLSSERKASQIARSITGLWFSLKTQVNKISTPNCTKR